MEDVRYRRRSDRPYDEDEAISDRLAAVHERLDELTHHLERVAHPATGTKEAIGSLDQHGPAPDHVTGALARLDRRLGQMIDDVRAVPAENDHRGRRPPPPPTEPAARTDWAAEISARQRVLDGCAASQQPTAPAAASTSPPPRPAQDGAAFEQQLRQITAQIAALRQPCEDALAALRGDLAEIGRLLREAMPRQAIQVLEGEVRALAERVDHSRQTGAADAAGLAGLERGLAEVRDALRVLTPAESLVGFEEAVRALIRKIDQIGAPSHDPIAFKQLEQAVVSLRGVVANVASDGALAQLTAEVRQLGNRFEQAAAASSTDTLDRLDARLSTLVERGRAVSPELESAIRTLCERLERMQLSQADQFAIGSLEDRIAKLSEKLDASDARLSQLGSIERGIADLLVEIRSSAARGPRVAAEPEAPATAARTRGRRVRSGRVTGSCCTAGASCGAGHTAAAGPGPRNAAASRHAFAGSAAD